MRFTERSDVLKVRAISGTHVVVLAWDFTRDDDGVWDGLLGFAVERIEMENGEPLERYWMRSIKRFRSKDKGLAPGSPVSTAEHPIQSFQWADYTARSGKIYRYRIVPVYGKPKLLELAENAAVEISVTTESDHLPVPATSGIRQHEIYFNRGVIGSQAYAREFGNSDPDPHRPTSREMVWLSHGLYEGLMRFIGHAGDGDSLHAALYEFHYLPVAIALAGAADGGAHVKIVYDAESSYKKDNEETIRLAGLDKRKAVIPRTASDGIRHNKFIVLKKGATPVAVWTGSTNISGGGIFGHLNVGHVVWDEKVASIYMDYWERLARNDTPDELRPDNKAQTPTPAARPPKDSITVLLSARDEPTSNDTLEWYADRMAEANEIVCFTVAFDLDKVFQDVIAKDNDVLRYIVKDDPLKSGEIIGQDRDVLFAAGTYLGAGALANFLAERDNPLNRNDYIHTKFMLVDPLSDDPLVVTGSANFSRASQRKNDENMLVIRGDTRVADIYFGEFMRIFDHHYARYLIQKLADTDKSDPDAGYLKESADEWVPSHFRQDSYKAKRRQYFVGE